MSIFHQVPLSEFSRFVYFQNIFRYFLSTYFFLAITFLISATFVFAIFNVFIKLFTNYYNYFVIIKKIFTVNTRDFLLSIITLLFSILDNILFKLFILNPSVLQMILFHRIVFRIFNILVTRHNTTCGNTITV